MDNSANVNPNIVWQQTKVAREDREETLRQRGRVVWFTGLSGSGKSTVAVEVERQLNEAGYATYLLDGDNVRHGLCRDLSFSEEDRRENIRRVSEVAGLFADAGIIVLAAFISPYRADRQSVRDLLDPGDFIEVYISTPIEVCEKRDVKGLYQKARQGKIDNFTGISAPYEPPLNPDIAVDTSTVSLEDSARLIKGTIVRTFEEAFRR